MTQMITLLTNESLVELAAVRQPPLLSLYQPTHRCHPDNRQDPIRFGNLVKKLEASLLQSKFKGSDIFICKHYKIIHLRH